MSAVGQGPDIGQGPAVRRGPTIGQVPSFSKGVAIAQSTAAAAAAAAAASRKMQPELPKRKRGRPRKIPTEALVNAAGVILTAEAVEGMDVEAVRAPTAAGEAVREPSIVGEQLKKKRGSPRKLPLSPTDEVGALSILLRRGRIRLCFRR